MKLLDFVSYEFIKSPALTLQVRALVNYPDYHGNTRANGWQMQVNPKVEGMEAIAFPGAVSFYLLANPGTISPAHAWYYGFDLALERYRGLTDHSDDSHLPTGCWWSSPGLWRDRPVPARPPLA